MRHAASEARSAPLPEEPWFVEPSAPLRMEAEAEALAALLRAEGV